LVTSVRKLRRVLDGSRLEHLERVRDVVVGDELRQRLEAVTRAEVGLGMDPDLVVVLEKSCQMAYFQTKNFDLGKFWRVLK
jgi:hypothetical protein